MYKLGVLLVVCLVAAPGFTKDLKFQPKKTADVEKKGVKQTALNEQDTQVKGFKEPAFCNKLDCPKFRVLSKTKDYELRKYNGPTMWVTTELMNIDFNSAQYTMFMRLFRYISGANDKKEKIDMTVPVVVRIIPGQGPACENNFTMSFFISPKVKTPPKPTDPTVKITQLPTLKAYVRSFGGFAKMDDWLNEAKKLAAALPDTAKYEQSYFLTGGYDAPFKLFKRHNEIWFLAK